MRAAEEPALPVRLHADTLLRLVRDNAVVVVIADTGSGKTTQLPQILLDGGEYSRVAVTQPRRVAAVSVARRVASERGEEVGATVAYSVRWESCVCERTRLLYLTDGCLLRELQADPSLLSYDLVVLDEAHERSLSTDILFALLKRLAATREPRLRLIVTSATLDGERFAAYFDGCPVLRIEGRAYPVTIAHALDPPPLGASALLASALDTVWEVHVRQPPGDVLLFLTGAEECDRAVRELHARTAAAAPELCGDLQALPLYAALSPEQQARVFRPTPPGVRRVVVATNLAETSLTVPGVVYVVDPGTVKQKEFQPRSGLEQLLVCPISRVAAKQRAGRAGRTCPGRCYRLYTERQLAEEMPAETVPEVQRCSLAGAVLQLKSLLMAELDVLSFDFLDPPVQGALAEALVQLWLLSALDGEGVLTSLGRSMARLPLDPPLARAALEARRSGVLSDFAALAGMLSAERVFEQQPPGSTPPCTQLLSRAEAALGDHVLLLRVFLAWEVAGCSAEWARRHKAQQRSLELARNVKRQLLALFPASRDGVEDGEWPRTGAGEEAGMRALRHSLCLGYAGKLARRVRGHNGYRTLAVGGEGLLAVLHPSCSPALADAEGNGLGPEWILYHELVASGNRPMLRTVCAVEGSWAAPLAASLQAADVPRLSGGRARLQEPGRDVAAATEAAVPPPPQAGPPAVAKADSEALAAARTRFLKRKADSAR